MSRIRQTIQACQWSGHRAAAVPKVQNPGLRHTKTPAGLRWIDWFAGAHSLNPAGVFVLFSRGFQSSEPKDSLPRRFVHNLFRFHRQRRKQANFRYPQAVEFLDPQALAVWQDHLVAEFGYPAEPVGDVPADRFDIELLARAEIERAFFLNVRDRRQAVDQIGIGRDAGDRRVLVLLVIDIADQFLDQVLQRDDAGGADRRCDRCRRRKPAGGCIPRPPRPPALPAAWR